MSLLGRPTLPKGARAFAWNDDGHGTNWTIRYVMPQADGVAGYQEETGQRPLVTHSRFTQQVVAYQFVDWTNGDAATFEYPAGRA